MMPEASVVVITQYKQKSLQHEYIQILQSIHNALHWHVFKANQLKSIQLPGDAPYQIWFLLLTSRHRFPVTDLHVKSALKV